MNPYLKMRNIFKSFPGVKALNDVNLDAYRGEVLALVGENGAGKSTLMKILTGVYAPDQGQDAKILIEDKEVNIKDTIHARKLGISIIYQELATVENLTVAENIFLGEEPIGRFGMIDKNKMNEDAKSILLSLNMDIKPTTMVSELSVGQQQMIEIAKAISYKSQIIVMDEPTASLSHKESRTLIDLIFKLKKQNIGIIYISHRLEEVFELADRITVLRDGQSVGTMLINEATHEILVKKMVDRDLSEIYKKSKSYQTDEVVLEVKNLSQLRKKNANVPLINNVSFKLHKGEILGFSGLVGSGRTEIMELIFGVHSYDGEIYIDGKKVNIQSPSEAINNGIGFVTEDRKQKGLVLGMNVRENFSLTCLEDYTWLNFVSKKKETADCIRYIDTLRIKTPSSEQKVINLSGGNQQKVIISKWVTRKPKILIVDEPTRGIDIGAKAEVHALLTELASQGIGIIMVSSELPEIIAMSDRIIVVKQGQITGEFSRSEANQEVIMEAAAVKKVDRQSVS